MANSTMLRELLRYHNVPAYLSSTTESVTEEGVVINTPDGQVTVPADSVIMSVGYSPDKRFAPGEDSTRTENRMTAIMRANSTSNVYFVGDCDKVGSLKTVIKQAYELVQDISYHR